MGLCDFRRFGKVIRFQKCYCDQLSVVAVCGGAALALRLNPEVLLIEQPGVEFVTFPVLAQRPLPYFLRAAFLVRLRELRRVLPKNEDEVFHE